MPRHGQVRHKKTHPPARLCIFCGKGNLSGEHVWPAWMGRHLDTKSPGGDSLEMRFTSANPRAPRVVVHSRARQSGPTTKKVRVVCRDCNNGWMSRLEADVQPIILPLMRGDATVLSRDAQSVIARWVALKVMVVEQEDPTAAVTTQDERRDFWWDFTMPSNLYISLFKCGQPPWRFNSMWLSMTVGPAPNPGNVPIPPSTGGRKNCQTMVIGFGDLLVFALRQPPPTNLIRLFDLRAGVDIWPTEFDAVGWPPPTSLTPSEATNLAELLSIRTRNLPWVPIPPR